MNHKNFPVWLVETGTIPDPRWALRTVLWSFQLSFYACAHRHSANTWGHSCRSPGLSLHAALSLSVLCPMNSSHLGLPGLPAPSFQSRETAGFLLGSHSLCHSLETQDSKLRQSWAPFICFLSLRNHYSLKNKTKKQTRKNTVLYILSGFFGCFWQDGKFHDCHSTSGESKSPIGV